MQHIKEKIDNLLDKVLIVIESLIAMISTVVLVGLLVVEVYRIFSDPAGYFTAADAVTEFLQTMLTIVVGLEFVKLLMHLTPSNILEVLIMAISRSIIVSHGGATETLLNILCIVALFAAKRFLISRSELHKEIGDDTSDAHRHHRGHRKHKPKSEPQQDSVSTQ